MSREVNINNFIKGKRIGGGQYAEVFLVTHKQTNEIYAAKKMNHSLNVKRSDSDNENLSEQDLMEIQSFNREIEIMSKISHPAIIAFIGYSPRFFDNMTNPTIIMEFARNKSLADVINFESRSLTPTGWDQTTKFINIYGIAKGMAFLHQNQVVHRDLKPENIMLNESYYPKIADFGFSKISDPMQNLNSKVCGTPIYMAPELLESDIYNNKIDVYSYSISLYVLLTLKIPFQGLKPFKISQMILNNERPPIPDDSSIPSALFELIEECWDGDPESRPSFSEICEKLESDDFKIAKDFGVDEDSLNQYIDYLENEIPKSMPSEVQQNNYETKGNSLRKVKSDAIFEEKKKVQFDLESIENTGSSTKLQAIDNSTESQNENKKATDNKNDTESKKDTDDKKDTEPKKDTNSKNDTDGKKNINNDKKDLKKCKSETDVFELLNPIYPSTDFKALSESCKKYVEAAEKTDVNAMTFVGQSLINGSEDFPQNVEIGVKFLQKAITLNNPESMVIYGEMLLKGSKVPKNTLEGIKLLKRASNEFDSSDAKIKLAEYYVIPQKDENDIQTYPDYAQAKRYSKEAADNGNVDAMVLYAKLCLKEKSTAIGNVRRNIKEARKYLKVAINRKSGEAMALYGQLLEQGYGIQEGSIDDAEELYKKSQKKGSLEGEALFGYLEVESKKKEKEGLKKIIESKEAKNSTGLNNYGLVVLNGLCGLSKNKKEAASCFKEAAEAGNPNALYNYAKCLQKGDGVDKNFREAFKYYKRAFEEGEISAAKNIAECLFNGDEESGFPKHLGEGNRYLKILADFGNTIGINLYACNLLEGFGIEKNYEEAAFYLKNGIEKNDSNSYLLYGLFLMKDEAEKKVNPSIGSQYIKKAIKLGNELAQEKCDIFFKGGKDVDNNLNEAIKYIRAEYNKE